MCMVILKIYKVRYVLSFKAFRLVLLRAIWDTVNEGERNDLDKEFKRP